MARRRGLQLPKAEESEAPLPGEPEAGRNQWVWVSGCYLFFPVGLGSCCFFLVLFSS